GCYRDHSMGYRARSEARAAFAAGVSCQRWLLAVTSCIARQNRMRWTNSRASGLSSGRTRDYAPLMLRARGDAAPQFLDHNPNAPNRWMLIYGCGEICR